MGQTLHKLMSLTGIYSGDPSELTASHIKRSMTYSSVPDNEAWRVPLCLELLNLRSEDMLLPGFSIEEQEDILAYVCSS